MKITPILYSPAMVKAKVAGIKTQTRRIVKPQPDGPTLSLAVTARNRSPRVIALRNGKFDIFCPYGQPGDVIYGKEAFSVGGMSVTDDGLGELHIQYKADGAQALKTLKRGTEAILFHQWKRKTGGHSSLFMFRSLSRIVDEIVEVRVERLQDISEADAIAEGIERVGGGRYWKNYLFQTAHPKRGVEIKDELHRVAAFACPLKSYRSLWESINGPGSWDLNPWVWVIVTKPFTGALP